MVIKKLPSPKLTSLLYVINLRPGQSSHLSSFHSQTDIDDTRILDSNNVQINGIKGGHFQLGYSFILRLKDELGGLANAIHVPVIASGNLVSS